MRLNAIERSIGYGLMRAKQSPARIRRVERELESIHHHLWHGDSDIVNWQIGTLVNELESTISPAYLDYFSPLRSTLDKMIDLQKYLMRFQDETISYSIEHREKQPVSTSPVESLINRLVNYRMNKRQQMRWSVQGAQSLLQLRVALLNRPLGPIFGHWYPGFSVSHMIEPTGLQAA
jgi:hypothetical protein